MTEETNHVLNIDVKRTRISVTQGYASVLVNGKNIATFGDDIKLISQGETYYGPLIGGWASKTPDVEFIKGAFFHPYDNIYHHSDNVKKTIDSLEHVNAKTYGTEENRFDKLKKMEQPETYGRRFIVDWCDKKESVKRTRFWYNSIYENKGYHYIAVDNTTGDCLVEEFLSPEECAMYLIDGMTVQEIEEARKNA